MKLNIINKSKNYSRFTVGIIFVLASSIGLAGGPDITCPPPPAGKFYVGVFGGVASSSNVDVQQYGTAFFALPLAVDAFGTLNGRTTGLVGGHVGYQWSDIALTPTWNLGPAVELEGYYLGNSSFKGQVFNETVRLPGHDFLVTAPTKTGIFLANFVLNFNALFLGRFHPYIGAGFGGAVASISNANSLQIVPFEPNVNHFNAHPSDTETTFAAQAKAGLSFDLSQYLSLFLEYRWLDIADSNYIFGSTVYPGHVATTSWQLKMDSHYYNIGAIGVQFSV